MYFITIYEEVSFVKRRISFLSFMLALLLLLCGCRTEKHIGVFEMPAYIAVPQNTENGIAFTLFFPAQQKRLQKQLESVVSCSFENAEVYGLEVSGFSLEQTDSNTPNPKYLTFGLILNYVCSRQGAFTVNQLNLICPDTVLELPLSPIYFDVGEETGNAYVDPWSSPAASSNPEQLLCNYQFSDMVDACQIYYAPDQFVELSAEQLSDGEIRIPLDQSGLMTYICTKIIIEIDGKSYTTYGKGCLCGALQTITDETLDMLYSTQQP